MNVTKIGSAVTALASMTIDLTLLDDSNLAITLAESGDFLIVKNPDPSRMTYSCLPSFLSLSFPSVGNSAMTRSELNIAHSWFEAVGFDLFVSLNCTSHPGG